MNKAAWLTFFYGVLILIGGVVGHIQVGSAVSLIAGTVFGVLLIMSSIGMFKDRLFPAYIGILLTVLLSAFFAYRYLLTFAFLPSGLICLISVGVLILQIVLIRNHLKSQRGK